MKRYRSLIVLIMDIIILIFSDWMALAFRFDFLFSRIPKQYLIDYLYPDQKKDSDHSDDSDQKKGA